MDLEGNSDSGTSAAFLERLRQRRSGPLSVIWDNAPAHRGEAVREYLRTPGLGLGEREGRPALVKTGEATGNLCLGSKAPVEVLEVTRASVHRHLSETEGGES